MQIHSTLSIRLVHCCLSFVCNSSLVAVVPPSISEAPYQCFTSIKWSRDPPPRHALAEGLPSLNRVDTNHHSKASGNVLASAQSWHGCEQIWSSGCLLLSGHCGCFTKTHKLQAPSHIHLCSVMPPSLQLQRCQTPQPQHQVRHCCSILQWGVPGAGHCGWGTHAGHLVHSPHWLYACLMFSSNDSSLHPLKERSSLTRSTPNVVAMIL